MISTATSAGCMPVIGATIVSKITAKAYQGPAIE